MRKIVIVIIFAVVLFFGTLLAISAIFSSRTAFPFYSSIAVIPVKGELSAESGSFSTGLSSGEIAEEIERAEEDASVAAILLEINSGGGGIVATREIVESVKSVGEKPVVAWISEVGASGAYEVAASADYIVADPDSITGSIGVIGVFPNIEGLLEKIGVEVEVLTVGEHKDIGSSFSELSEEDREIIMEIMLDAFARFKAEIISLRGEKLNRAAFDEIADGRILNGSQALEIGLVDELGTKDTAIAAAESLAGVENAVLVEFGKKDSGFVDLFSYAGYSFGSGFKKGLTDFESGLRS